MYFGSLAFVFEVMVYVGLGLPLVNLLLGLVGNIGHSGADIDTDMSADMDVDLDFDTDIDVDFDLDLDMDLEVDMPGVFELGFDADAGGLDVELDADALDADFELAGLELEGAGSSPGVGGSRGFPVRFNIYCLCLALVVMGAIGVFAIETLGGTARLFTLAGGVGAAIAAYCLVYRFIVFPLKKNNASALKAKSLRFRHAKVTFRITRESPGKIQTQDAVGAFITYQAELDPDICKVGRIDEGEEIIITDVDKDRKLCYVTLAQRKILS